MPRIKKGQIYSEDILLKEKYFFANKVNYRRPPAMSKKDRKILKKMIAGHANKNHTPKNY